MFGGVSYRSQPRQKKRLAIFIGCCAPDAHLDAEVATTPDPKSKTFAKGQHSRAVLASGIDGCPPTSERITVFSTIRGNMTDICRRSREEIIAALSSGSPKEIRDALIIACYWDKDWKWALQQLRKFAEHGDYQVLWAVATGVGFIAAFNGEIDEPEARSILTRLKVNANSAVATAAQEAEANIEHFLGHDRRGGDVALVERRRGECLSIPAQSRIAIDSIPSLTACGDRTLSYPTRMLQAS
jgi:hypothetical protein